MATQKKILITGTAGFIGFHTVNKLLKEDFQLIGIDNINDYYDVRLKYGRLHEHGIERESIKPGEKTISTKYDNYCFYQISLEDEKAILQLFEEYQFDYVIHLAAQAGVRYSLTNPHVYVESNVKGFLNILEACRYHKPEHLLYASTSSVYGNNKEIPFTENQVTDGPISLYAATKKANELMAFNYAQLFGIPISGLRFFTVYGPWGRPDMALFLFTEAIIKGEKIKVFNHGDMMRDFTFVEDVVEGIVRLMPVSPKGSPPVEVFNIGNSSPVQLEAFIIALEQAIGKKALKEYHPMQAGDVSRTYADTQKLNAAVGYQPSMPIEKGVEKFVEWYNGFYEITP